MRCIVTLTYKGHRPFSRYEGLFYQWEQEGSLFLVWLEKDCEEVWVENDKTGEQMIYENSHKDFNSNIALQYLAKFLTGKSKQAITPIWHNGPKNIVE